jgi:hypothetical protein
MKTIKLTQGKSTLVDDEDFEWLNQWKWHYKNGYASRTFQINGKSYHSRMHREIINPPENMFIDHIDHNTLNNCRSNLRICTSSENARNRKCTNKSGYKGVVWDKNRKKWDAVIWNKNRRKKTFLGQFSDPIEAAKAYDNAAKKYYGEFAKTNF